MSTELPIVNSLFVKSREDLVKLAEEDPALLPAIIRTFPECASHIGFTLFDPSWTKAYGRQILRAIGHAWDLKSWNFAEETAVKIAIGAIAEDLTRYLGLSPSSTFAVAALVIVIVRGLALDENTRI
jgi:hypothetical protein